MILFFKQEIIITTIIELLFFFLPLTLSYTTMMLSIQNYEDESYFTTRLCLGDSNFQCFHLRITFQSFYLWNLMKTEQERNFIKSYNTSISSLFHYNNNNDRFNISYKDQIIEGIGVSDNLELGNNLNISDFKFVLSDSTHDLFFHFEGVLGLGYLSNSSLSEYSFLEQLYERKIIHYKIFGIEFTPLHKTQLFFGGVPESIIQDYYHYGNCDVLQKKQYINYTHIPNWVCLLKSMRFDRTNQRVREDIPVVFSLNSSSIFLPYKFIEKVEREYEELVKMGSCWFDENNNTTTLYCSIQANIPTIYFNFDNWKIVFQEKLLKSKSYYYYYKIFTFVQGKKEIVLSMDILKYFTLVFDREKSQIGFYNSEFVIYTGGGILEPPQIGLNWKNNTDNNNKESNASKIKAKIIKTLYFFGFASMLTVLLVVTAVIFNKQSNDKQHERVYTIYKERERELDDIDIRDTLKEGNKNVVV